VAYVLRITLILTATWVANLWQFELLGAAYLLWLVSNTLPPQKAMGMNIMVPAFLLWQAIPLIALTDLAFPDSVTTAIAVSQETWLVLTGATIA